MPQKMTESFITTTRPGAYFDVKVKSTPVGAATSGNIVIMGEARGGAAVYGIDSTDGDILKDNYYTPDQLDRVVSKYISGPIVDAFRALSSPSGDNKITGSANRIYIAKTNTGTKSQATIATTYGTLADKNYGIDGDKYYYQISKVYGETAPTITGSDITFSAVSEVTTFVAEADAADSLDGDYILISSPTVDYHIWFNTTGGAAVDPNPGTSTPIEVALTTGDAAIAVADAIRTELAANFPTIFTTDAAGSATLNITAVATGAAKSAPTIGTTAWGTAAVVAVEGDDADGSFLNGASFSIRENGEAASVITLSANEGDHDSITELAAEIQALLTTATIGVTCVASGAALLFTASVIADNAANALSYGRSFELIDSTLGDLAALGHVEGLNVASQEPEVQVDINRQDTNVNEEHNVKAEIALNVGYEGTSATFSFNASGVLSTVVVGGTGASITALDTTIYPTLKDLADYLNSQDGYTASVTSTSSQLAPSALDVQSAVGICSSIASTAPGKIKQSAYNFTVKVGESTSLDFTATATAGLPDIMASVAYLSGGVKGFTTGANIVSATSDLETIIAANFVIPLFSRDASDDIADDLTDSSSTYTIAAINAGIKSHVLKMSTPKIKRHRTAFLSYWGTFAESQDQAGSAANARVSVCFQKSSQLNSTGSVEEFFPWYTSCIAAGMQAAGFYKAIVNKYANVISFTDPTGFDSGSPGDIETAIGSGLLFMEKLVNGNKWVSDQTTYGVDTNFVYNSVQAMYTGDILSLDLAASFQAAFVGESLADVDAGSALAYLSSKMDAYKKQKLIAASSDAPLGFKNAKIEMSGPIMRVSVEIKLSTAIYFIPINIEFSQVQSSAIQ